MPALPVWLFDVILLLIVRIRYIIINSLSPEFQNVKLDEKSLVPYLNKLKRKEFPKSPKTMDEIISAFNDEETKRLYGKYYVDTQNPIPNQRYGFTVLCDRSLLETVQRISKREIFMDGTFEIVKRGPYQQLLIIYVAYEREVYTCSVLMNT